MTTELERVKPVTPDQIDLIKRTVALDATEAELKLFLFDCARQGVHPLDRLIHFTKRGGKYTPITSIDFMRIRAAETNEYAGSDDAIFPEDGQAFPARATVTVHRLVQGQKCQFTATARWSEYKPEQNDFMWRKMPHTMLAKCAEALALRKGFPRQLAGLYAKEEMDQAERAETNGKPPVRRETVPTPKGDQRLPESWKGFTREVRNVLNEAIAKAEADGVDVDTGEVLSPAPSVSERKEAWKENATVNAPAPVVGEREKPSVPNAGVSGTSSAAQRVVTSSTPTRGAPSGNTPAPSVADSEHSHAHAELRTLLTQAEAEAKRKHPDRGAVRVTETDAAISVAQQKRIFAVARDHGWRPDEIKLLLRTQYGIEASSDLPSSVYDEVIRTIQQGTEHVF